MQVYFKCHLIQPHIYILRYILQTWQSVKVSIYPSKYAYFSDRYPDFAERWASQRVKYSYLGVIIHSVWLPYRGIVWFRKIFVPEETDGRLGKNKGCFRSKNQYFSKIKGSFQKKMPGNFAKHRLFWRKRWYALTGKIGMNLYKGGCKLIELASILRYLEDFFQNVR